MGEIEDIKRVICDYDNAIVAFSGGVDSTLVAKLSSEVMKSNVIMVTIQSEFTKSGEVQYAQKLAAKLRLRHKIISVDILGDMQIIGNTAHRCYYCKKKIMNIISKFAEEKGISTIFDGSNYSDLKDDRPGLRALREKEIISPLMLAKISKAQVRKIAAVLGLPNYNRARQSCLATRIAVNQLITKDDLKKIDQAEEFIESLGIPVVRVRIDKNNAMIQTYARSVNSLLCRREEIVSKLRSLGFKRFTLDLEGYPEEMFEWS
ncbi:ATP-dependent sacrificial sulfur transferase LarE [Candidatus Woesearchaeota archaeon]|nr:ATP-dependent sacrificial sulfur transferase LarE [Candidatus Woesearchaeota archaeon]